jgi:DNA-binding transcriptional LysR family regulator
MELRVFTDTSAALTDKVLHHKLDCAFIAGPVIHPELVFDELIVEELVQVHAAGSNPLRLPLILFREGCAYRARALAWQRSQGHPCRPTPWNSVRSKASSAASPSASAGR